MPKDLSVCLLMIFVVIYVVNGDDWCSEWCPCSGSRSCGKGWEEFNGHCYAFKNDVKVSWDEAKRACQDLDGKNAYLVKIESTTESNWIKKQMQDKYIDGIWIGLRKSGNNWKWTDGSIVEYINWNFHRKWRIQEPSGDGDCGQIRDRTNYRWNDEKCSNNLAAVCERDNI